jgi:hypothetical protein
MKPGGMPDRATPGQSQPVSTGGPGQRIRDGQCPGDRNYSGASGHKLGRALVQNAL